MGIQTQDKSSMFSEKKVLPKKPSGAIVYANMNYPDDILDISFDEDFWMSEEPKINSNRQNKISREEDCFQSIWDIHVTVSENSEPPSEGQIIAENRDSTLYFPIVRILMIIGAKELIMLLQRWWRE